MTEKQRAERILANLTAVNEDLLALKDDVGHNINYNDRASRQDGNTYIEQLEAFQAASVEIATLIRRRYGISEEEAAEHDAGRQSTPSDPSFVNRHVHHLGEDFTFTKPIGFVLDESAFVDLSTWRGLLVAVCNHVAKQNPSRFAALPDNPKFVTQQGYHMFARVPPTHSKEKNKWLRVTSGTYVYVNLSANDTCSWVAKLLSDFSIAESALKIYLRQDRDAVGNDVA